MKNPLKKSARGPVQKASPAIAIMIICFLCGIVSGCVTITYSNAESMPFLDSYIQQYNEISQIGVGGYSYLKTLFNMCKYPTLIFLLSFTALGVLCIPCAVFLKGFFVSMSASAVVHAIGVKGIWVALSMFGIQTFISLPCILIISSIAFEFSKVFADVLRRNPHGSAVYPISLKSYVILFSACIILLLIAALADMLLTPFLINLSINVIK